MAGLSPTRGFRTLLLRTCVAMAMLTSTASTAERESAVEEFVFSADNFSEYTHTHTHTNTCNFENGTTFAVGQVGACFSVHCATTNTHSHSEYLNTV
jgi:hypothetical protein